MASVTGRRTVRKEVQYQFKWGTVEGNDSLTWETAISWCTDWSVDFNLPWLSKEKVMQKCLELDRRATEKVTKKRKRV